MRTNTTRDIDKQEGRSEVRRQAVSSRGLPQRGGLAATLIGLHRTHGNRFVQRLLADATHREPEAPPEVEEAIHRTRGEGRELPPGVRTHMESAFGADFSPVRLHTDATADTLSRSLSALAFTTGQDIYFRQGQYDPDGAGGRRLLAHELTHVAQQEGTTPGGKLVVGEPGDMHEQEADRMADVAMQHTPGREIPRAGPVDARAGTDSIQRMGAEGEEEPAAQPMTESENEEPAVE